MATNPYTSPTLTGYRAVEPPDDGSQSSANQVEWAKHVDQLGDPLRSYADDIDAATLAAFGQLLLTDDPAEETVLTAAEEFGGIHDATTALRAIRAVRSTFASFASNVNGHHENLVVGMEEFG